MALCLVLATAAPHHGDNDVGPPSKLPPFFLLSFPVVFLYPFAFAIPFAFHFLFFICSRSNPPYVCIPRSYPSLKVMSRVNQELVTHHHHHHYHHYHPDLVAALVALAAALEKLAAALEKLAAAMEEAAAAKISGVQWGWVGIATAATVLAALPHGQRLVRR